MDGRRSFFNRQIYLMLLFDIDDCIGIGTKYFFIWLTSGFCEKDIVCDGAMRAKSFNRQLASAARAMIGERADFLSSAIATCHG